MRGTAEDITLAQKVLADMDRSRKVYRLTYSITEMDGGKPMVLGSLDIPGSTRHEEIEVVSELVR
jgi:hypothetical protein